MTDNLGEFIKNQREKLGISKYRLAKDSNLSHTYIAQLENGSKTNPSPEILSKIAPHLEVSYYTLLEMAGHLDIKNLVSKDGTSRSHEIDRTLDAMLLKQRSDDEINNLRLELQENINYLITQLDNPIFETEDARERVLMYLESLNEQLQIHLSLTKESLFDFLAKSSIFEENSKEFFYSKMTFRFIRSAIDNIIKDQINTHSNQLELSEINRYNTVLYKGKKLEKHDIERVLEMLKLLFSDT